MAITVHASPSLASTTYLTVPFTTVDQDVPGIFSAIVAGENGVPTGTVTFTNNGSSIGSATLAAETYTKVVTGRFHSCAITQHGALVCFGENTNGQLGVGDTLERLSPAVVFSSGVTDAAGGYDHGCAVVSGALWCWGGNAIGQLGSGDNVSTTSPVKVINSGVTAVSAGSYQTCAVVNGDAYCWGANFAGQVGNGQSTAVNTPTLALSGNVTAVASGEGHNCAIQSGGLLCWGYNGFGQLGDGNTTGATDPGPSGVPGLGSGVTDVSAHEYQTCAVHNGALKCWGRNHYGQLANGTTTDNPNPQTSLSSGVTDVEVGREHACAIQSGQVKCWGRSQWGQIGDGQQVNSTTPVNVSTLSTSATTSLASSGRHSCAIDGGQLYCWGLGGVLGDGTNNDVFTPNLAKRLLAYGSKSISLPAGNAYIFATYNGDTNEPSSASLGTTITVRDKAAPVLTVPANRTVDITSGGTTAVVSYSVSATDNVAGAITIQRTAGPASGAAFPLGVTTVTHTATDVAGNVATRSFTVTVRDRVAPTLNVPANRTVQLPVGGTRATVIYAVSAADNAPGTVSLVRTAGPASGSSFPVGVTTVTYRASDAAGNQRSRSFTITVTVRNLNGTNGNDKLDGSGLADTLSGGLGNDRIDGKGGADTMAGGKGDDIYFVDVKTDKVIEKAGEGTDTVITPITYPLPAHVEKLTLTGSAAVPATGNDLANTLKGNGKANRITGKGGADILIGGKSADVFAYASLKDSTAAKPDSIIDFKASEKDKIDLKAVDANSKASGDQAFTFIGTRAFSKAPGELRFAKNRVEADVNGDGKADLVIKVKAKTLKAADFRL